MNPYDVLKDHHTLLRGLCQKISATPLGTREREDYFDELMVEFDIHLRIEDDLHRPAMSAASTPNAGHRQISDQLAVLLRTSPTRPEYDNAWESFRTALEAHGDKQQRDLAHSPPDAELKALGIQMTSRITQLRDTTTYKLQVRDRAGTLGALPAASAKASRYRYQVKEKGQTNMFVIRLLDGEEVHASDGDKLSINHDTGVVSVCRVDGFEEVTTHYSPSAWGSVTHRVKDARVNRGLVAAHSKAS